jgi:hypothetical protein
MMLDAETRAVVLADAQMELERWRTPDPDERDEADTATECIVCTKPMLPFVVKDRNGRLTFRKVTAGQKVCRECSQKGWRSTPCVCCSGPTKSWAWSSKARRNATRGMCDKCRAAWHLDNPAPSNARARYMVAP